MARKYEALDRETIIAAIYAAKGKVTLAARALGCTRKSIYDYANRYATVKQAIEDARGDYDEELLDIAEHKLRENVLSGEQWAIRYALDKKGRTRGYSERHDLHITDWRQEAIQAIRGGQIEFNPLAAEVGESLADELFRAAGVKTRLVDASEDS